MLNLYSMVLRVSYSRLVATTVLAAMEDVSLLSSVNFNRPPLVLATMSPSPRISVEFQNVLPIIRHNP